MLQERQSTNGRRIAVFIDGSNIYHVMKKSSPGRFLNYRKLMEFLHEEGQVIRANYYAPEPQDIPSDASEAIRRKARGSRKLLERLENLGYAVKTKPTKTFAIPGNDEHGPSIKHKNNSDVEMTVDATLAGFFGGTDEIFLVTDDGDFSYLARRLREAPGSPRVTAIGTRRMSRELRESCDRYVFLDELPGVLEETVQEPAIKEVCRGAAGDEPGIIKR